MEIKLELHWLVKVSHSHMCSRLEDRKYLACLFVSFVLRERTKPPQNIFHQKSQKAPWLLKERHYELQNTVRTAFKSNGMIIQVSRRKITYRGKKILLCASCSVLITLYSDLIYSLCIMQIYCTDFLNVNFWIERKLRLTEFK